MLILNLKKNGIGNFLFFNMVCAVFTPSVSNQITLKLKQIIKLEHYGFIKTGYNIL